MQPVLALNRVGQHLTARVAQWRQHALSPAEPHDTLTVEATARRPLADRAMTAFAASGTRVWRDHASAYTFLSHAYMAVRQFLPTYALNPELGSTLLAGTLMVSLVGPLVGDSVQAPNTQGKHTLPPLAQRALILGLVATHCFVFREAEVAGMAASAAVHTGARMLPNVVGAQTPAAWAALGAYIATSQAVLESVDARRLAHFGPRQQADARLAAHVSVARAGHVDDTDDAGGKPRRDEPRPRSCTRNKPSTTPPGSNITCRDR